MITPYSFKCPEACRLELLRVYFETKLNPPESWSVKNQLAVQRRQETSSGLELVEACGSFPRRNVPFKDRDFTVINREFEHLTPFLNSCSQLVGRPLVRTRIMELEPKTCLSYHKDVGIGRRLHIVLRTNDSAFFVVEDEVQWMQETGRAYTLDTTKRHTAVNAHYSESRIHLVSTLV